MSLTPNVEPFIARWKASGASERANYQLFLTELCDLLGMETPRPASDKVHEADYTFERPVVFDDGEGRTTTNFIDLYKRHCFVLEAKQGADKAILSEAELLGAERVKTKTGTATRDTRSWEREMKKAKEQALRYARALPAQEGWPPFLVVVDVGYCIDLYADFARQGKTYVPFPDPQNYRIQLEDLHREEVRQRLHGLFTDPLELDPSRRAARVTRQLAERLARLAALLEEAGHGPEKVAGFLMRCLFTMFAEDVQLLPDKSFTRLLQDYRSNLQYLPDALRALWCSMDRGGFDPALHTHIPQFNGFLFKDPEALPLSEAQLDLLIQAAEAGWADVEPAIFGTLLERALQPRERHKLGAHYTPRAYVERLVMPTVIEPLREEWEAARTASAILEERGDEEGARKEIEAFQRRLCSVRVLDPACGSGNFLYVTLEHLKRLEGEVTEYLAHFPRQLGLDMTGGYTVTPQQLLGLEVNPRAAAIADVVLWIGYLQWHFRAHGNANRLGNPILREYGNIRQQDAVLSYSERKPRLDSQGEPITRWDGHTTKQHPVTGLEVPDETARTVVFDYLDPKPAAWPEADFIVGNPPFIGTKRLRQALGDGYVDALFNAYKGKVPGSADFVMYWWYKAAEVIRAGMCQRFGFITTNSLKQPSNRQVIKEQINASNPLSLMLAIPDHPWVDSNEGAAVEIAMTIAAKGDLPGRVLTVKSTERSNDIEPIVFFSEITGKISADLTIGINLTDVAPLRGNKGITLQGCKLVGSGFKITHEVAERYIAQDANAFKFIKKYITGSDLNQKPTNTYVIDFFPFSKIEVQRLSPVLYQHLLDFVYPERVHNADKGFREKWWLFGRPRPEMRTALEELTIYFITSEVSKHRVFLAAKWPEILIDGSVLGIALSDFFYLGIVSSRFHQLWAIRKGGDLGGNTPRYFIVECFETFPFPIASNEQKQRISTLAEQLDAHRKQRQTQHPTLTITDMYNVLEKLRSGEALTAKEQKVHEQGLVSILKQLHDELDAAVAAAYGWPYNLPEEEVLERLVTLNKERAAEEARGSVRWLRPEYQNPQGVQQTGIAIATGETAAKAPDGELVPWPKTLAEQAQAVQRALQLQDRPVTAEDLYRYFKPVAKGQMAQRVEQIESLLQTLQGLGLLRRTEKGQYVK